MLLYVVMASIHSSTDWNVLFLSNLNKQLADFAPKKLPHIYNKTPYTYV